jgi:peptidoglycan/xylan/chitin deacetylase (PgdA/CDA1 family)
MHLHELTERIQHGQEIPPGAVAVTFDDGYRDTLEIASSILSRYQVPATVFVATAFIGSPGMFWWDAVAEMVKTTSMARIDPEVLPEARDVTPLDLRTPRERGRAIKTLIDRLRGLTPSRIAESLRALRVALRVPDPEATGPRLLVTWEEVEEMQRGGITIQSHTHTHRNLAQLTAAEVEKEFRWSKELIEARTGQPVSGVAYPWGLPGTYTEETAGIAARSGFQYACIAEAGSVTGTSDPFALRRLAATDQGPAGLSLDLLHAYMRLPGGP